MYLTIIYQNKSEAFSSTMTFLQQHDVRFIDVDIDYYQKRISFTLLEALSTAYLDDLSQLSGIERVTLEKDAELAMLNHCPELHQFGDIVAHGDKMLSLLNQAKRFAQLDEPLLIMGETGTGKDMFAEACHRASKRYHYPFLALNCAGLPDEVAESELFGHAQGAYLNAVDEKKGFFEQANGGTVLLDEIGEMSSNMQAKLLRFINNGTFRRVGNDHEIHVNVRVICTTQANLLDLVQQGVFREDLFYRLNVFSLVLPPLRDRKKDIAQLIETFVAKLSHDLNLPQVTFTSQAYDVLSNYDWPGNIRQLKNSLYLALTRLSDRTVLDRDDFDLPNVTHAEVDRFRLDLNGSYDDIVKRVDYHVFTSLYKEHASLRKLAKRLGVSHTTVANKIREYNLKKDS